MPHTVIVIRHATPDVLPERSPDSWPLSPAGRIAAGALGRRIPSGAFLAASDEVKAIETMSLAAGVEPAVIHIDDRFGEVHRRGEPFDDNHRARRRAWVEGRLDDRHDSWETPEQAGHRFQRGLDDLDADVVAVASHGMVITAWLVLIGQVSRGKAAGNFWENLAFPDVVTVAT